MSERPKYLKPDELVARWGGAISKETLSNWRAQGKGPASVKIGGRVVYPLAWVEAYERQAEGEAINDD